ncbi:hypothetical protein [Chitinivorax sp. B]|uniref:hypothetical protein n=1 Tax=Chitinivorax sp. B TaxID=2502235 RepID=UPI0010F5AF26|nr:hypothetical protein [Chitinivorax sp. B]
MSQAKTTLIASLVAGIFAPVGSILADIPADSDYNKDKSQRHVHERAAETFDMVNEILCYFGQTKYASFVNKGPYKAMVDANQCSSSRDDGSNSTADSSSTSNNPSYMDWVIDVTRADNTSSQIVKFWIDDKGGGDDGAMKIHALMTITEAASDKNPYGLFKLDFIGHPVVNGQTMSEPGMRGYMEVAKNASDVAELSFFNTNKERQSNQTRSESAVIQRAADGSSGSGKTGTGKESFSFAFDSSHFLRGSAAENTCFSRDQRDETVWRYGLYDVATGQRVDVNSGFPIKVEQDGKKYHGWVGYWGLHLPREVMLNNGDTVYKEAFGKDGAATPYTLLKAGGRLQKHTRKTLTLADIAGVLLDWQPMNSTTRFQIKWDKDQGKFFKVKSMPAKQEGEQMSNWEEIKPAVALSASDLENQHDLNAWSQALGGQVRVAIKEADPTRPGQATLRTLLNTTQATVMVQTFVGPNDSVPSTLACFDNCPDVSKFGVVGQQPYWGFGTGQHDYTFDSTTMLLKEGNKNVVLTATYSGVRNINSGPMFEPNSTNMSKLACDWNTSQTCSWKAWQVLDSFYTWQTGIDQWNQLALLKDSSGKILKFDQPKLVTLVYTNADLGFKETKFQLEYGGFGNLHGIPGDCVHPETNLKTACGPNVRFVPVFSIPTGTEVTDATPGSTKTYLVKALDMEQRMKKIDTTMCSSLTLPTNVTLPDGSHFKTPDVGDEPTVSGGAAVVGGVIKTE